jgi:hypothetical protein
LVEIESEASTRPVSDPLAAELVGVCVDTVTRDPKLGGKRRGVHQPDAGLAMQQMGHMLRDGGHEHHLSLRQR